MPPAAQGNVGSQELSATDGLFSTGASPMRTIICFLALSAILAACSIGDISFPDPSTNTQRSTNTQLTGNWTGEVSDVRISMKMDTAVCEYGCSGYGVARFVQLATGDSGTALVSVLDYIPGVPSNSPIDFSLTVTAADDTQLQSSFSAMMPDASHLVGRFVYDNLLQIDTGSTITFTRQ
jgi:hypothetical protein